MTIDWAATGAMLQGEGTMVGALAVLGAAWFGKTTFEAWRKQQIAERKLFQAERLLEATYKARRALSGVRSVAMFGSEISAAEEMLKGDEKWNYHAEAKQKRMVKAQAYYNRLNRTLGEREALDQCLPMARALFGEKVESAVLALNQQFWIVKVDVDCYIDDNGADQKFSQKLRRGMYEADPPEGEVNEVTEAAKEAVQTIEDACLPVLRS